MSNSVAAFWAAFSVVFYVFIYSIWLKRSTSQNIVIGGIAGSTPPLVGWSASMTLLQYQQVGRICNLLNHGFGQFHAMANVPDHIPVDATSFLGTRSIQIKGIRRCGRPHATEC